MSTVRLKAVLLARFSPRPNADECESCDAQLLDLEAAALLAGYDVVGKFRDEAISGDDWQRPGLWQALAALKPGSVLMVRNLNRLARDTLLGLYVMELLDEQGAQLYSLEDGGLQDTSPIARFIATIKLGMAALQKHEAAQRTSRRMREHQASGRPMSKIPPYGWRVRGEGETLAFVHDENERSIIEQQIVPRHELGQGPRSIARDLEEEGILFRGRARWRPGTVYNILARRGLVPPRKRKRRGARQFLQGGGA